MCEKESEAKKKLQAVAKYGHCLQVLCKDSDVQLLWPSYDELYAQVSSGIIFNNKASEYIYPHTCIHFIVYVCKLIYIYIYF